MLRFLHSRLCLIIVAIIAALAALTIASGSPLPPPVGQPGIVPAWSGVWLSGSPLSPYIGPGCLLLTAILLVLINNTYNLLRNITHLQASAFIIMQMAAPALVVDLCAPAVSTLIVLLCMYLIFSTYAEPGSMSTVFLIFFILSASAGFDAIFIALIPVFILACAQMRILSLRAILATLMGLATPWILLLGFGIISPEALAWPQFALPSPADNGDMLLPLILAASLSAFVLMSSWVQNLIKYLTYNAHSRAMLSTLTVLSILTLILAAIGWANLYACLPLLNMCAALQLGHLFGVVHTRRKSYIAILCIFLPFILLTIWTIALCI